MPTELLENQHELLTADGAVSLVFGTVDTGYLTMLYPALEAGEGTDGDVQRVREDGVAFGEDYRGGKTFTFEIAVLTDTDPDPHAAGAEALNVLEGVWTDERFRDRSSAYGVLRSNLAGRVTRCYGRPRRYAETPGRTTPKGYTPVVADFAIADGRFYDDTEQQASVGLITPASGSLVAPLEAPLVTTAEVSQETTLTVGGSKSTWPVVTFHGPVMDPEVTIGPLKIGLKALVTTGVSVTVDPRPWVRTVTRSDGANQAGKLSYATPPLRKCTIAPGTHETVFRGIDATGTSWCEVRWRNARARP